MADSGNIDAAIVARLSGDATLLAVMTDGVYVDVAPSGKTKFVIVSLIESHDTSALGDRSFEEGTYLVKAVAMSTSGASVKTASARIDTLLDRVVLTATGYASVVLVRDERVRFVEVDEGNQDLRWQHSGARYSMFAST